MEVGGEHFIDSIVVFPYQRSMWNNLFFAAVTEYWRQLDEKENTEKNNALKAHLAKGWEVFEV